MPHTNIERFELNQMNQSLDEIYRLTQTNLQPIYFNKNFFVDFVSLLLAWLAYVHRMICRNSKQF